MDQNHFTTDTLRKKGAHLTFEERVIIQTRLRDKQSYRSIAREIGCCVNTGRNEGKRGARFFAITARWNAIAQQTGKAPMRRIAKTVVANATP